jgi:hypothetical protein
VDRLSFQEKTNNSGVNSCRDISCIGAMDAKIKMNILQITFLKRKGGSSLSRGLLQYVATISKSMAYLLLILILLASKDVNGNGYVDLQVGENDKRIATQIRAGGGYFFGAVYDSGLYFSGGYGFQFTGGFALLSYSERKDLSASVHYRRPKTNWGVDVRMMDNLDVMNFRIEGGISYYTGGDDFAITLSYEDNKTWLGVRRWF